MRSFTFGMKCRCFASIGVVVAAATSLLIVADFRNSLPTVDRGSELTASSLRANVDLVSSTPSVVPSSGSCSLSFAGNIFTPLDYVAWNGPLDIVTRFAVQLSRVSRGGKDGCKFVTFQLMESPAMRAASHLSALILGGEGPSMLTVSARINSRGVFQCTNSTCTACREYDVMAHICPPLMAPRELQLHILYEFVNDSWTPDDQTTKTMVDLHQVARKVSENQGTDEDRRTFANLTVAMEEVLPFVYRYGIEVGGSPVPLWHNLGEQGFESTVQRKFCGADASLFRTDRELDRSPAIGFWSGNMSAPVEGEEKSVFNTFLCGLRRPSQLQVLERFNGKVIRLMGDSIHHGNSIYLLEKWFSQDASVAVEAISPAGCNRIRSNSSVPSLEMIFCYRYLRGQFNDGSGVSVWGDEPKAPVPCAHFYEMQYRSPDVVAFNIGAWPNSHETWSRIQAELLPNLAKLTSECAALYPNISLLWIDEFAPHPLVGPFDKTNPGGDGSWALLRRTPNILRFNMAVRQSIGAVVRRSLPVYEMTLGRPGFRDYVHYNNAPVFEAFWSLLWEAIWDA